MDSLRIGRLYRALRHRGQWRQVDVAARAGVSASTIGRIEAGQIDAVPLGTLETVARALGADAQLYLRYHGEAIDRLLDEGHAELVDATVGLLEALGWQTAVEVSFSIYGERGSIDVLARHRGSGIVLVVEVKSVVPDVQATLFGLDRKERLAPIIARQRGWTCEGTARLLVVGESRTSRRRVARHAPTFDAALPARGRDVRAWLRQLSGPMAGLLFVGSLSDPHGAGVRRAGRPRHRVPAGPPSVDRAG